MATGTQSLVKGNKYAIHKQIQTIRAKQQRY